MNRPMLFDSPFLLGFEHTRSLIERAAKAAAESYPPYNVEQLDDGAVLLGRGARARHLGAFAAGHGLVDAAGSARQGAVNQVLHLLAVILAQVAGRGGAEGHHQLLFRVGKEAGAIGAVPAEFTGVARHGRLAGPLHHQAAIRGLFHLVLRILLADFRGQEFLPAGWLGARGQRQND